MARLQLNEGVGNMQTCPPKSINVQHAADGVRAPTRVRSAPELSCVKVHTAIALICHAVVNNALQDSSSSGGSSVNSGGCTNNWNW
jgi:hypothetical protein